jgi:MFS family permease
LALDSKCAGGAIATSHTDETSMIAASHSWRSPLVVLLCGCLIAALSFGPRSALGFFLSPMSAAHGWGRDLIGLALAIQMLIWGAVQPFAGAIADRFGAVLVLSAGAVIYAVGLALMAHASTPSVLHLSAGILIGIGLAGSAFTIVIGAFAKLMPPTWRSLAFGAGTAASSFGQFLFSPLTVALMAIFGWRQALEILGMIVLLVLPLSLALAVPERGHESAPTAMPAQSVLQSLSEAFGHPSYVLLTLGYFTCGFQVFFIGVHLPAYLVDRGLSAEIGGWTLATIGLFNILGSIGAGVLGNVMPKRFILSAIYFGRSLAILIYIVLPPSPATTLIFGAVMGLLWLSTVPPTSSLVAIMFGTRWLAMLLGIAFFSHQLGGFLGVWLGGLLFEQSGSYDVVWWLAIALGVLSALINLPIVEKPVHRAEPVPA